MRVLYVDDDPIMTSAVVRMLDSEGFDCDTADLGKTAVDLAKRNKYDIVLLDVMLPDIDGYEVIKQLRSAGLRTPVLLQSGLVDRENDFEGLWLGASEYLLKPFNKTELVERIEAVLSRTMDKAAPESRRPSDPSIPAEEVDSQRRRHRRFETVQPGTILSNGGIDCLIMDMSYGGAALQLSDPDVELPDSFDLQLQSGSTLRCSVRWRSGERVGVQAEALLSDEVIAEVLKQGDGQPAPAHLPAIGPERSETTAEAKDPSSQMPEPQPDRVVQGASGDDRPRDLRNEDPPPPGPESPALSEHPATTAETAPGQGPIEASAAGGAVGREQPEAGAEAAGQPSGPPDRPQRPPETAPEGLRPKDADPQPQHRSEDAVADDGQIFTVDRGTRLVAESCECEELVVDGHLEAAARARRLLLGREGRFVGSAEVERAEIRGRYEGNLIVTGSLVIFPGATVSGTTRYRQIVIEAGGGLIGQAQLLPKVPAEAVGPDAGQPAATPPTPRRAAQA